MFASGSRNDGGRRFRSSVPPCYPPDTVVPILVTADSYPMIAGEPMDVVDLPKASYVEEEFSPKSKTSLSIQGVKALDSPFPINWLQNEQL